MGSLPTFSASTAKDRLEIRYVLRQDTKVLATKPITVTALKPNLSLLGGAVAGEMVAVTWEGPNYSGDYFAVDVVGGNRYINYTATTEGSPLWFHMPAEPGDYEVRYVMRQDTTVNARAPITVGPVKAQLLADRTAAAGTEVFVGCDDPDYSGDYIAISKPDSDRYETYASVSDGNPVTVRLPDEPGDYEIRYVMRQDNTIVARLPLTLQ